MTTIQTTLQTTAVFSEDGTKRYSLQKTWDKTKPTLAAILFAPSSASGITLDSTTLLVLNNADRLGYGEVSIVNLFATLDDFHLRQAEKQDSENEKAIVQAAKQADTIVYAPGVGKAGNKAFQLRQQQVLTALSPFAAKLRCLCREDGGKFLHPLSPSVRTWALSPFSISELLPEQATPDKQRNKKTTGHPKLTALAQTKE